MHIQGKPSWICIGIFVLLAFLSSAADESDAETLSSSGTPRYRYFEVKLEPKTPFWSFMFNDMWPKATFSYILRNVADEETGRHVHQGVLVIEVAEDKGDASLPEQDEFHRLTLRAFEGLPPQQSIRLKVKLGDELKPGRFWLKPTVFLYPEGTSPLHKGYADFADKPSEILNAWEQIFLADWEDNLGGVLGTQTGRYGMHRLIIREVYTVASVSGLSLAGLLGLLWIGISRAVRNPTTQSRGGPLPPESLPTIHVARVARARSHQMEIFNASHEDIVDFQVEIAYENDSGKQERRVGSFIAENEDPLRAAPRSWSVLRSREKILMLDLPRQKLRGPVRVHIRGTTGDSGQAVDRNYEV